MSTIAAISTPIGVGGIGIVRVSGSDALEIADAVFSYKAKRLEPMRLTFGKFEGEDFCDLGYAVYIPKERAYTGEDTVEFYLHGGVRIMQGALDALLRHGARLAEGGEFTRRAFLAGRLSLADAEGVIDMINAESAAALNAAYRLMSGELAKKTNAILDELETLIAGLEATLDYPEETEDEVLPSLEDVMRRVLNEIGALLGTEKQGRYAKYGIRAAIVGNVNAGKSSLFNAMLKRDRAIVTAIPGTTRDSIEADIEWKGVKITLVDTAGIRESDDEVEAEGIRRTLEEAKGADVILNVIDRGNVRELELPVNKPIFNVYTKSDLFGYCVNKMAYTFAASAFDKTGIDEILDAIASQFQSGGGELITNERHISALYQAKEALESAILNKDQTVDCILIDLRRAYDALGEITGKTATEDVIDAVFSKFCVGK